MKHLVVISIFSAVGLCMNGKTLKKPFMGYLVIIIKSSTDHKESLFYHKWKLNAFNPFIIEQGFVCQCVVNFGQMLQYHNRPNSKKFMNWNIMKK